MNDIAKQRTVDKFKEALTREGLSKAKAGACIGFTPVQVSYLFNPTYWVRLGNTGWEIILKWVNSGESLIKYAKCKAGITVPKKEEQSTRRDLQEEPAHIENEKEVKVGFKEEPKNNVLEFIRAHGCRVVGQDPDIHYYYLPFWYRVEIGQEKFEMLSYNQMPEDLKKAIKAMRGE